MSPHTHRLIVGGLLALTVIGAPAIALASTTSPAPNVASSNALQPSPPDGSGKSGPSPSVNGKTGSSDAQFAALASSLGIDIDRLQQGLAAAKLAGGAGEPAIAAFAAKTGVSNAAAQSAVEAVFGAPHDNTITGETSAAAFASRLHISVAAAQQALREIVALNGPHGVDPSSPRFAAIAHGLGVTAPQMASALDAVKQAMSGK